MSKRTKARRTPDGLYLHLAHARPCSGRRVRTVHPSLLDVVIPRAAPARHHYCRCDNVTPSLHMRVWLCHWRYCNNVWLFGGTATGIISRSDTCRWQGEPVVGASNCQCNTHVCSVDWQWCICSGCAHISACCRPQVAHSVRLRSSSDRRRWWLPDVPCSMFHLIRFFRHVRFGLPGNHVSSCEVGWTALCRYEAAVGSRVWW